MNIILHFSVSTCKVTYKVRFNALKYRRVKFLEQKCTMEVVSHECLQKVVGMILVQFWVPNACQI